MTPDRTAAAIKLLSEQLSPPTLHELARQMTAAKAKTIVANSFAILESIRIYGPEGEGKESATQCISALRFAEIVNKINND